VSDMTDQLEVIQNHIDEQTGAKEEAVPELNAKTTSSSGGSLFWLVDRQVGILNDKFYLVTFTFYVVLCGRSFISSQSSGAFASMYTRGSAYPRNHYSWSDASVE
jgi:hypothetical protein